MANMIEYVRRGGNKRYTNVYVNGARTAGKKQTNNKGGHKVGVMVAVECNDGVHIGWSLCNKTDVFDVDGGITRATGRALSDTTRPLAQSMVKKMHRFIERVKHCYKDKAIHLSFSFPETQMAFDFTKSQDAEAATED